MRVRLIHVTQRRSGAKARREEILNTDRLTVGRGTDNALPVTGLIVPLHHSLFVQASDGVYVEAIEHSDLRVNDRSTGRERVAAGDVIRVGSTALRVLRPQSGENLVLEIEHLASALSEADQLRLKTEIGIERGLLTRRKLSWAAVALVPALLLAVPLIARRDVPPVPLGENLASRLPLPPAPASRLQRVGAMIEASWSTGPLSSAHANLAAACVTCHRFGYQAVRNEECIQCHPSIGRHARQAAHAVSHDDNRCASCHVEHEGDPGLLGFGSDMCSSCHADLKRLFPENELLDVSNFSQNHNEFRASVLTDPIDLRRMRVPLNDLPRAGAPGADQVQERSGLKFSHAKHLRANLRGPQGSQVTLECSACHVPERSGQLMQPPRFAEHCQSCHPLAFDTTQPGREVPHKQPQLVEQYTFEFYAARVLQGDLDPVAAPRRMPGKPLSPKERDAAMALASERAGQADQYLLGPAGVCSVCHTLTEENGQLAVAPIVLVPAAGADRWLPLAKFSHSAHTMARCVDCHAAAAAESAGVVILPGIDTCRRCHGDLGSADEVPSTCMKCHQYHHPDRGRLEETSGAHE